MMFRLEEGLAGLFPPITVQQGLLLCSAQVYNLFVCLFYFDAVIAFLFLFSEGGILGKRT